MKTDPLKTPLRTIVSEGRFKKEGRKKMKEKRSKKESIKKETEKESSYVTAFVLENDSKRSADLYVNWPSNNKD